MQQGLDIYAVDEAVVQAAKPDLLLSQAICEVCAISSSQVTAYSLHSLDPQYVCDVLGDIRRVAAATGTVARGEAIIAGLQARPEMIDMAGGINCFGDKETGSYRLDWEAVIESQPEIVILMLCGYTVQRALEDLPILAVKPGWHDLPAVRHGQVFAVDAGAYTSRSGPRLVQGLGAVFRLHTD